MPPDPVAPSDNLPDVPGYGLASELGRGLHARTFLATQRALQRSVAVKLLDLPDAAAREHFATALQASAKLSHPNIAGIQQIGRTTGGNLFWVLPLLPKDVSQEPALQRKSLRIAACLREVLDALAAAHAAGVVHGGIKPSNLRIDGNGRVQVCDFGLAGAAHAAGLPLSTTAAAWISPEQVRGEAPNARSDLYSLAVVAWELLTGAPPYAGNDALATAMAHIQQPIPRLPAMLGAWQAWMDKALAKAPDERFRNARAMVNALASVDGRGDAPLPPAQPTPAAPRRRLALGIGLGAAAAIALATIATVVIVRAHHSELPPGDRFVTASSATPVAIAPAQSAMAVPASASSTVALAARAKVLVDAANVMLHEGHLFAPASQNAATAYLAALKLDPGNATAQAGVDSVLARQQQRLASAWQDHAPDHATALLAQGDGYAANASPAARRDWTTARSRLAGEVGAAVVAAASDHDARTLATLKPLATALPARYPAGFDFAAAERDAAAPRAGDRLRDPAGPTLVYAPAGNGAPAFAIARHDVTHADYATFARATHRPAAACRSPFNLFSRLRDLSWQSPGFVQGGNDPVVCVSWNDATAYAAWLSQRTGQPYRLPDNAEWQRAAQGMPRLDACQLGNVDDASHNGSGGNRWTCSDGASNTAPVGRYAASGLGAYGMYGNVSQWLSGSPGEFRGLSWRSGRNQSVLGAARHTSAGTGYDNIGFRVVRVIDAAHPAPPRAKGG